jgi:MarR family transcriptional regulator for hemolysin
VTILLSYDFHESLGYWLLMAHHSYMRAFSDQIAPHGITYRQAQVLGWLSLDGPLSQAELAARMLIEPPSLVGVLDRMADGGLIERRSCPDDRRKNLIHPLPAAEEVWTKLAVCGRHIREQARQGMSDEEVDTLKRLLNQMRENVEALEPLEVVS